MLTSVAESSRPYAIEAPHPTGLASLFCHQPVETFEAGTAVVWQGEAGRHVFEVVEGVLRVFRILSDGRRVITGFIYPGELLGVSLRDRYLYTAEAITPTKVRRFDRLRFQDKVNGSPELRPQLFARLCDEMAAAQDQMVLLARKSAEERVCSFLLSILRRTRHDDRNAALVPIPMTRLDMADYLGLTIETVSRIMTKLSSRGLIAPAGRHAVTVRNTAKLIQLAGDWGEDDTLHPSLSTRQAVWPH